MSLLRFDRVGREIGTFVILDEITAAIALGDRIGLVGPNGAGKTTLLRLAAGIDEPDHGTVSRKRGLSLGLLAQESHFDAVFMAAPDLRSAVRTGAAHLDTMAAELADLERAHRVTDHVYADLQHRYEVLGGYTLDQRVDATLSGLGFGRAEWSKPPTALSGGEQTRAALARLVIADPELLMLDEPTNHLDLDALEWLEEHLRRRHGSLVVASHDRAFLDATVSRVWELRDRRLTVFRGDYSQYRRQRDERDVRLGKDVETQSEAIAREKELVQRYRSHRKFAKMHEHEARLERLEAGRIEAPKTTRRLTLATKALTGAGPSRSGEIVVRAEELVVGYLPRLRRASVAATALGAATEHERAVRRRPGAVPRRPARGSDRHRRPEWRRQDDPAPDGGRRAAAARRRPDPRWQRVDRLPRPAARGGDRRHHRARRDPRGDPDHARRGARLPGPVPVPGRRRLQGGPDAVGRRALAARAGLARDHARQPAPARRADEPSRHPGARGDRDVHARDARRPSSS